MSETGQSKAHDLLGVKPIGEAVKIATEAAVKQDGEFLDLICKPPAKEFGLLLKDQMKAWRQANLVRIANKAEKKLKDQEHNAEVYAHPRVVGQAVEAGSWTDDNEVQDMWAGLIASTCTEDGKDESNLVFVQLLGQLTANQAKFIKFLCENSQLYREKSGWVYAGLGEWDLRSVTESLGYANSDRFRTEVSHLRQLGLIDVSFDMNKPQVLKCGPTVLALDLYIRCQGSRNSITNYYENQKPLKDEYVIDFPNHPKLIRVASAELREDLHKPSVTFSFGQEGDLLFVGVKNTGLIPIHDTQLNLVIPQGEVSLKANFHRGEGHSTVIIPGETQRWYFPMNQSHFMLRQPIKQFILSQPPDRYLVALEAQGAEVGHVEGESLQRFFQRF